MHISHPYMHITQTYTLHMYMHLRMRTDLATYHITINHNKTILDLGWVVWVAVQLITCWIWCFRCTQTQYHLLDTYTEYLFICYVHAGVKIHDLCTIITWWFYCLSIVLLEFIQLHNESLFSGGSFWPMDAGFHPQNFILVPLPGDKISTSLRTIAIWNHLPHDALTTHSFVSFKSCLSPFFFVIRVRIWISLVGYYVSFIILHKLLSKKEYDQSWH